MPRRLEALHRLRTTPLGHTILSLYGLQAANYILPLVSFPYLTRTLGPDGFGLYVFVLVVARYLILVTDYGFTFSAARDVAVARQQSGDVAGIYGATLGARLCLLGVCAGVIAILTVFAPRFSHDAELFWIAFVGVAGSTLFPVWLYQGYERLPVATGCNIAFRAVGTALIFVFVHGRGDLDVLVWLWSLPWLATGIVTVAIAHSVLGVHLRLPSPAAIARAFRSGLAVFVAIISSSLYITTNTLFLGLLRNNTQVGYYGAAESVIVAVKGLIDPVSQALFPRASQIGAQGRDHALGYGRWAIRWIGGLGLVLSIATLVLSPFLPDITGAGFEPSVKPLQIMSVLPFATSVIIVLGVHVMLPLRMDRTYSLVVAGGGFLNVVLTFALVPGLGATGTAIAVAITESAIALALYLVLRHRGLDVLRAAPAPGPA